MSRIVRIIGIKCKACGSREDVYIICTGKVNIRLCADCRRDLLRTLDDFCLEQFMDKIKTERGCNQ